jgi:hypothetical protein
MQMGESLSPIWAIRINDLESNELAATYWQDRTFPSRDLALAALSEISEKGETWRVVQYVDNSWRQREEERFLKDEYKYPAWLENPGEFERKLFNDMPRAIFWNGVAAWSMYSVMTRLHFVHLAKGDPAKIAYTESAEKGMCDRQTVTTVGRYLTKHFSDFLTEIEIATLAAIHAEKHGNVAADLKFAKSPDEFEKVYSMDATFSSCMQYHAGNFSSDEHPCRVYGAGDLELAYLTMPGDPRRLNARALIWRKESATLVGRVYGDGARLRQALANAGIVTRSDNATYDRLDGAKLLRIEADDDDVFILPYIDGSSNATDHGTYLTIDSRGDIAGGNTNGLSDLPSRYRCERCGDRMEEDDSFYIDDVGESWCEHCYSHYANYCERTEQHTTEDVVEVRTRNGNTESWSQSAAERYAFQCEKTDTWYHSDYFDQIEMHDGTNIGPDYFENECFICEISDEVYHINDCVTLDGENVAKENLPQGAVEVSPDTYERHPELELEVA